MSVDCVFVLKLYIQLFEALRKLCFHFQLLAYLYSLGAPIPSPQRRGGGGEAGWTQAVISKNKTIKSVPNYTENASNSALFSRSVF